MFQRSVTELIPPINWAWEQADYVSAWHEPLFTLIARYIPEGSGQERILEVGAGGSHTLGAIAVRRQYRACGVEPDPNGITTCLRLADLQGARVNSIRGDGFRLPFCDNQFDIVYSLGLIEHFHPLASTALVAEHARVCRNGGRVIISVPNLLNIPHTIHKIVSGKRYPYYPERSYTPRGLRRILETVGLRVMATDGLLPLWGLGMMRGGWRLKAILDRLGLSCRLNEIKRPYHRALIGYMVFAVGEKS